MTMHADAAAPSAGPSISDSDLRGHLTSIASLLRRFPLSIHQLLFRLAVAAVFFRAGLQKARGWETTIALFSDEYKLPGFPPEFAAVMATCFELGCSTLLILGLATLPLLGMIMTIRLLVYPQAWLEHLVWGSILVFLLTRGPGAFSLDRLIGLESSDSVSR